MPVFAIHDTTKLQSRDGSAGSRATPLPARSRVATALCKTAVSENSWDAMHGGSEARLPAAVACGSDMAQASQPLLVSLAAMLAHGVGAAIRLPAAHVPASELRGAVRDASPLERATARRLSPLGPRGGCGGDGAAAEGEQRTDRRLRRSFRRGIPCGLLLDLLHVGHQHSQRALRLPALAALRRGSTAPPFALKKDRSPKPDEAVAARIS